MQDGSDIVCHGIDTINTETQEVSTVAFVHVDLHDLNIPQKMI